MEQALRAAVARQRMLLRGLLTAPMERLTQNCAVVWPDRAALEQCLVQGLPTLPSCKDLYVLDQNVRQITANITKRGLLGEHFDRDRRTRPYLRDALAGEPFSLSDAYIGRNARCPSLTAVQ
jgi:hypothetical protein